MALEIPVAFLGSVVPKLRKVFCCSQNIARSWEIPKLSDERDRRIVQVNYRNCRLHSFIYVP